MCIRSETTVEVGGTLIIKAHLGQLGQQSRLERSTCSEDLLDGPIGLYTEKSASLTSRLVTTVAERHVTAVAQDSSRASSLSFLLSPASRDAATGVDTSSVDKSIFHTVSENDVSNDQFFKLIIQDTVR